ncbi:Interleukin-3 receptor class 2 subunit beta [Microtus ochrogaster]|uniref:Interleukin-3 receptor class 2 subunit beta n=1 Tax=Microtus ochrogaster TaxID=79684 RepID=A0A8J6L3V1_MICOH|nr:Interleukin-3 receptor class 2 subunit beta [Microtus ochrogaster]
MDQQMALTWSLLYMALLALCWKPGVTEAQDTIPLQTLRCYNDYTSRIICSWADLEDAQGLINMTLYRNPGNMTDEDYYSFQPDRDVSIQLVVPLAQHVQPPPPKDIRISPSGDHFLLKWNWTLGDAQVPWLSQEDVEFEVAYKRLQDTWEDAPRLNTSDLWVSLASKLFLPSNIYVARVRTRLSLGSSLSGKPSRWSPGVQWNSQPGDKAQPQNLQCFFDGIQSLSCSWEVWNQVASSVSFGLFYRPSPAAPEKECSPVVKELQDSLCSRYHCNLTVSNPSTHSQYAVSVKLRKQGKFIKSSDHIQMHPPSLKVTKDGDSYNLRWETKKLLYSHIQHKFQVQYKKKLDSWEMHPPSLKVTKDGDSYNLRWETKKLLYSHIQHKFQVQYKKKLDSWEDSKTEILDHAHSMSLPRLVPSTSYSARVRVKPLPEYFGIWSEWSEECTWTTDWVMPTWGIVLILIILILILLLALRFGCAYGCRLYRKWKEKIPNPSKSLLFQLSDGQRDPPTHFGKPESQKPNFDLNGPYLGPPTTHSLTNLQGQLVPPEISGSLKPELPHTLEYLCLPPGGQVQLVPLSQAMGMGQAVDAERESSLKTTESPSMEQRDSPSLDLRVEEQEPKDNAVTLSLNSGGTEDPVVASGYVTPADLVLTLPTGPPSTSLGPSQGLPSAQGPSLCITLPGVPPGSPALPPPEFDDYVELPPSISQPPKIPLGNPVPPVPSSTAVSPGEHREEVAPTSPHHEGLLVLQQVGDYCFLPGLAPGSLSPHSKPPSPGLCPEMVDLDQNLSVKKPSCEPMPQVPAIQFFKSLKHQDYLSLPPWDSSQPGKVC